MRKIKIYTWGCDEVKEVTLQEAKKIINNVYADPFGGVVMNRKTGKVFSNIGADVDEIYVVPDDPVALG